MDFHLNTPITEMSEQAINTILYGSNETIKVKKEYLGVTSTYYTITLKALINY